jgi:hypothetical protein
MLTNHKRPLPQRPTVIRIKLDCCIVRTVSYGDRSRCGNDPADMLGVTVPHFDPKWHVGVKVIDVRIGELTQQSIHAEIEIGGVFPERPALSAQLLQEAQRIDLTAVVFGGLTHENRQRTLGVPQVKGAGGGQVERHKRLQEISAAFPHHVDLVPPLDGFASSAQQAIMDFLEPLIGKFDMYGDCDNNDMFIRYCFSDAKEAMEFRDRFGSAAEKVGYKIAS